MKYIISERQFLTLKSLLFEQKDFKMDFTKMTTAGFPARKETGTTSENMWGDQHTANLVFGIASAFIPVVGPFISAGIGLADAALYYKEGDTKTAGMVAMFSLLPGVFAVTNRIPAIKQLGVKGMSALAKKIAKGEKITDSVELAVIEGIKKGTDFVKSSLDTHVKTLSQQAAAKTVTPNVKNTLTNFAKSGLTFTAKNVAPYVGAGAGYEYAWNKFSPKQSIDLADIDSKQIGKNNQAAATQIQF
tara:strand:+ start:3751 stop:4488 length:738 start_codon:yes stop_codon:yes gene_type:complete